MPVCKGMLTWRGMGVTLSCLRAAGILAVKRRERLTYTDQLQVTSVNREITVNWGDSDVKEFLLRVKLSGNSE